jgi:hypothetical protein
VSYHVVVDFVARVVSKLNVSVLGWRAQLGAETAGGRARKWGAQWNVSRQLLA